MTEIAKLELGTSVNGYVLESVLGEGGMATVYRANQMSLNRPVAIKILHQTFSKRHDFLTRFERESEALGQLQHPNIVAVIDRGCFEDHYYFVMELVEGSDLDHLLAEYEFDRRQIIQIVNEVGRGVAYVHSLGIVHRDMKPANILIGSSGAIKVSDFGIAQIARGTDAGRPITGEGTSMGTGIYMAPEQMADAKHVDARADIYALGATFYKLITRRLPMGKFPMPSEVREDMPDGVNKVILRALDPDPETRTQTAKELCRDLILALQNRSTGADAGSVSKVGASVSLSKLHAAKEPPPGTLRPGMGVRRVGPAADAAAASRRGKAKGRGAKAGGRSESRPAARMIAIGALVVVVIAAVAGAVMMRGEKAVDPAERARVEASLAKLREEPRWALTGDATSAAPRTAAPPDAGSGASAPPVAPGSAATGSSVPAIPVAMDSGAEGSIPVPAAGGRAPDHLRSNANMVPISAGSMTVGEDASPLGSPAHREWVNTFLIDCSEVSNADYALFVAATGARAPAHWNGAQPADAIAREPVHAISRSEAMAFAAWAGKRLPTEEEWERAASNQSHGGQRFAYPWGAEFKPAANLSTGRLDNVDSTTDDRTLDGVVHLGGNVAEWTSSTFSAYKGSLLSESFAPRGQAVIRGGSALDFTAEPLADDKAARVTRRAFADPRARIPGVGFRCARDYGDQR